MQQLIDLFRRWAGCEPAECLAIGAGGSSRRYYRLVFSDKCSVLNDDSSSNLNTHHSSLITKSVIGALADDLRENEAFFAFSRHLRDKGMPVPELYAIDDSRTRYLQQDLGDQTLYGLLYDKKRQGGGFDAEMLALYRQALADLAAIQQAGADADFSLAYPRPAFDRQAILWDLSYFKYYFLKLAHIPFDEQLLEDDFNRLAGLLLEADCNYFMYRDFQGRNIMISDELGVMSDELTNAKTNSSLNTHHSSLYYIDYQGARRGAAQYDVASLLYSAKSDLPEAIRRELITHYLDCRGIDGAARRRWMDHFWLYLYVRILQTLGAYGYRGLYERKDYFLQSIPLALGNLRRLADEHPLPDTLPHLKKIVSSLQGSVFCDATQSCGSQPNTQHSTLNTENTLTVTVQSFSYKQGLPTDPSGNGGGHIFDCRALPNPGRYAEYKSYTGKDRPVIEFLQREPAVGFFLDHVEAVVRQSVDKYLERRFTHLSVAFGCTGGQHRSVYCAEQLAARLRQAYPQVIIDLRHREQDAPR